MGLDDWKTTSTIVASLRLGRDDRSSWELVSEHFREPIVRLAQRMGLGRHDAQDAAQEALIAFAAGIRAGKFDRSKGRLRSWLFGIARRQILKLRASEGRHRGRAVALADGSAGGDALVVPDPAEAIWDEEWVAAIHRRALRQVRAEVRAQTYEIFVMSVIEQRRMAEVMERFGVADTVVYNARSRIGKRIEELLEGYEDV